MLYSFNKYKNKYTGILNYRLNYSNTPKCSSIYLAAQYMCIKPAPYFRRLFFRSLLIFLNLLYSNFFHTTVSNNFYFVAYMYMTPTIYHSSFLCKKIYSV